MVLGWWFGWFSSYSCSCSSRLLWSLGKGESLTRVVVRPKKYIIIIIKKLMLHTTTIIIYIYTVIIENVYIYTFIHSLICVVLRQNCVNFTTFSIYWHLCECYHIAKEGKLYEKLGHIAMWTRGHVSTLEHMSVS